MKPLPVVSVLVFGVAGCGGGGGGPAAVPSLSGVLNVADFRLPAGQSRRVDGDLRINATGDIDIEGELIVDEGVTIVLNAKGDLEIGAVRPSGQVKVGSRSSHGFDSLLIGRNANIRSNQTYPPRTNLNIVCRGPEETVTIGGSVTIEDTRPAQATLSGASGGSIRVGGTAAKQAATNLGVANTHNPKTLNITANLTAGAGGRGGDHLSATILRPGNGGLGGSIEIAAINLTFGPTETLRPGAGGHAGWAGRAFGVRAASTREEMEPVLPRKAQRLAAFQGTGRMPAK